MTKNKIKSLEDFKNYNIICTTTKEVKECLKMLNTEEQNKDIVVDSEERIVVYGWNNFISRGYAEFDKDISFYQFKKIYNQLKKQQEQEPKTLVEFMRKEPIDVIIENENDYDNIIDYLDKQGIKWGSGAKLINHQLYYDDLGCLSFYRCDGSFGDGLVCGPLSLSSKKITVRELFKKFKIEYKEVPDFEVDENGRIIKINNYNSDKRIYFVDFRNKHGYIDFPINIYTKECWDYGIDICILFNTLEAVNNYIKYLDIHTKLKNLADRLNNGEKTDWKNFKQNKYFLYFNYERNIIDDCILFYHKLNICSINENFKNEAIKEIGEEDLKWYLQQSY